jgi:predicted RNase H-like HicB family nuclease
MYRVVSLQENNPEVTENLKKALEMHLKGMEEDGEPLPVPLSEAHYIAI